MQNYENDAIRQAYELIVSSGAKEVRAQIGDFMRPNPEVILQEATLKDAIRVIVESKIDSVPIVNEESNIVGIITKTLILREIHNGTDVNVKVENIMKQNPLVSAPDKDLLSLIKFSIGSLPVVEDGKVIGIITISETTRALFTSFLWLQQELRTVIDSTHGGIVAVNTECHISLMNPAAERILGIPFKDLNGQPLKQVLEDDDLQEIFETRRSVSGKKLFYKDRVLITNINPLKNRDQYSGMVLVLQDVSDFETISHELQTTQKIMDQMNTILETSFDGIFLTDRFGKILRINPAFLRIIESTEDEILDKSIDELTVSGLFEKPLSLQKILEGEPVTTYQELKTGKSVLITSSPVINATSKISLVVHNVRDITELNSLQRRLEQEARISRHYKDELSRIKSLNRFVFKSKTSRAMIEAVLRVAKVDVTVLLQGESGVGKEVIAEILHENSSRKGKLMVSLNCAAIPENLLESELFGYEPGAFSGAAKGGKIGLFEMADGGTLFLDEIAELPVALQPKLLRTLEKREIMKVGGRKPRKVDVRIIAATNRDLQEMVAEKTFRKDLYFRLNIIPILIPTLSQRKDEIPELVAQFLEDFNSKYGFSKQFSSGVLKQFIEYEWPGNIRELKNYIERTIITSPESYITSIGDINAMHGAINELPGETGSGATHETRLKPALENLEKDIIKEALENSDTTREAAGRIGISQPSLIRKASKYGIKTSK